MFASPRRLNLRLLCTNRRHVRAVLGHLPAYPLVVYFRFWEVGVHRPSMEDVDNMIAALEHRDRICKITLTIPLGLFHKVTPIMQRSFLALSDLHLCPFSKRDPARDLSSSFLGGSAPRLRSLYLENIPFLALPKLLLSTKDLVSLQLLKVPRAGYISPDAMVTCLSSLTRLETLRVAFPFCLPHPDLVLVPSQRPSPTRVELPALAHFSFHGANGYLEDFVARINATLLSYIRVSFVNQSHLDISHLSQFIDRVGTFKPPRHGVVQFSMRYTHVNFSLREDPDSGTTLAFYISCTASSRQISSLAEFSRSPSSPFRLSSLERLDILDEASPGCWKGYMKDADWLELLLIFADVKDLYLSKEPAESVAWVLQELSSTGGTATLVLPALRCIFVKGDHRQLAAVQTAIWPFASARQLPVAVHIWE